jgi:hypothetical protein
MGSHATRLDRVLAAGRRTDAEIAALDLPDVRRRRAEAHREETDLSYLRRVLHGRIDIITAEQARRAQGEAGRLVDRLSAILRDDPPVSARSARHLDVDPGAEPGEYRARMEAALAAPSLTAVLDRPDAELSAALEILRSYERGGTTPLLQAVVLATAAVLRAVSQTAIATSATSPSAASTVASTVPPGTSARSVHVPGAAKKRNPPSGEVGTSAVNSPVESSRRT